MSLNHDLAQADHIASFGWWKLGKYCPYGIIEEMNAAYADIQATKKKYKKAKHRAQKRWYRFWLKDKVSRFVSKYGPLCDLAAAAH